MKTKAEIARAQASSRWHKRNRKKYRKRKAEHAKRWRLLNPVQNRLHQIKGKCKMQQIPFNLTLDDLQIPTYCPVLNVPLKWDGPRDSRPTVDRVIPSKGYVKGNVRIISQKANELKGANTLKTLNLICEYIESTAQ